jgi:hypothetical protein
MKSFGRQQQATCSLHGQQAQEPQAQEPQAQEPQAQEPQVERLVEAIISNAESFLSIRNLFNEFLRRSSLPIAFFEYKKDVKFIGKNPVLFSKVYERFAVIANNQVKQNCYKVVDNLWLEIVAMNLYQMEDEGADQIKRRGGVFPMYPWKPLINTTTTDLPKIYRSVTLEEMHTLSLYNDSPYCCKRIVCDCPHSAVKVRADIYDCLSPQEEQIAKLKYVIAQHELSIGQLELSLSELKLTLGTTVTPSQISVHSKATTISDLTNSICSHDKDCTDGNANGFGANVLVFDNEANDEGGVKEGEEKESPADAVAAAAAAAASESEVIDIVLEGFI